MKGLTCVKTADRWYKVRVIEVDKQKAISGGHTESNFLKFVFKPPDKVDIVVALLT